jgi:hypothetical protein
VAINPKSQVVRRGKKSVSGKKRFREKSVSPIRQKGSHTSWKQGGPARPQVVAVPDTAV